MINRNNFKIILGTVIVCVLALFFFRDNVELLILFYAICFYGTLIYLKLKKGEDNKK